MARLSPFSPEIQTQKPLPDKLLHTSYLEDAGINAFEHIRESLRDLIKCIPVHKLAYETNFGDEPLTNDDLKVLERILWSEVGTKQDYETEFGAKPLGEFVREIEGLDMHAAKGAFSECLSDTSLDTDQIYFVSQFIEYIVQNGLMKDLSVLLGSGILTKINI